MLFPAILISTFTLHLAQGAILLPFSSVLSPVHEARQVGVVVWPPQTSTSSFDWWPYPPGGVEPTPTQTLPVQPTPPVVSSIGTGIAQNELESNGFMLNSESSSDSTSSASSLSSTSTSIPISATVSELLIHITAPTVVTETNSPNNPARKQKFNIVYLTPLFALAGVALGVSIGLLLHSRWGAHSARSDRTREKDIKQLAFTNVAQSRTRPWWRRMLAKLPGGKSQDELYAFAYDRDPTFNPPGSAYGWYTSKGGEIGQEGEKHLGYGEYNRRSRTNPHLLQESDEDMDLADPKGWMQHHIRDRSPIPDEDYRNDMALDRNVVGAGNNTLSNDKYTSLPRRNRGLSLLATSASPSLPHSKYSLLVMPFLGRSEQPQPSLPPKHSHSSSPSNLTTPRIDHGGSSGIRKTSAGKKKEKRSKLRAGRHHREEEDFADGDAMGLISSSPRYPKGKLLPAEESLRYGSPPPVSALSKMIASNGSFSEDDGYEGGDQHFVVTPRERNGDIKHKSIRRVLAARTGRSNSQESHSNKAARWTRLVNHSTDEEESPSLYPTPVPDEADVADLGQSLSRGYQVSRKGAQPASKAVRDFEEQNVKDGKTWLIGTAPPRSHPKNQHSTSVTTADMSGVNNTSSVLSNKSEFDMSAAAMKTRKSRMKDVGSQPLAQYQLADDSISPERSLPPRSRTPLPEQPAVILSPPLQPHLFFTSPISRNSSPQKNSKHSPRKPSGPVSRKYSSPTKPSQAKPMRESPLKQQLATPSSPASVATSVTYTTPPASNFSSHARAQAVSRVESIVKRSYNALDMSNIPSSPTGFGAWDSQANLNSILRDMEAETFTGSDKHGSSRPVSPANGEEWQPAGIEQRLALLKRMEQE